MSMNTEWGKDVQNWLSKHWLQHITNKSSYLLMDKANYLLLIAKISSKPGWQGG